MLRKQTVIIVGASGQDGFLASSLLLKRGLSVVGVTRESNPGWRKAVLPEVAWVDWKSFTSNWPSMIGSLKPKAIFHLAGNSSVEDSWKNPDKFIEQELYLSTLILDISSKSGAPIVMASSSQVFTSNLGSAKEGDHFAPKSPYGLAKLRAHQMLDAYRAEGSIIGSSLFMFNHDSPLRRETALSQKVAKHLLDLALGRPTSFLLTNSNWKKDYSWAPDFALAICNPKLWTANSDFVLASGQLNSMGDMLKVAADELGLSLEGNTVFLEGQEPPGPSGDASKAREVLGFESRISGTDVICHIVQIQMEAESRGLRGPARSRFLLERSILGLYQDFV